MTRNLTLLALTAAAALAGCDSESHTITADPAGPDPMANAVANAGSVDLPPPIAASKIYRCKDNSVVYVDWLADKQTANFRSEQTGTPTQLKAPAAGEPLVAEGYSLEGSAEASTINLTRPGKGAQTCKA